MRPLLPPTAASASLAVCLLLAPLGCGAPPPAPGEHEPAGRELFASPQTRPIVADASGQLVYVANTTSHSVSVIHAGAGREILTIPVGLEPVSLAIRPDGAELWCANHVSDSVSVIDIRPGSAARHQVVATIQALDEHGATRFDEPASIAFASNEKAYVALSSRNEIAVVDIDGPRYTVRDERIRIPAQDPRAMAVRDGRLYVAAFESMNRTELSICPELDGTEQCTLSDDAAFLDDPNLPGLPKNIVVDPDVPDRDLFVFDTADETPVGSPVEGVGTLLYGIAVDGAGRVFVTQAEARNAVNGLEGENLIDLDNRMFLNRITRVDCGGGSCGSPVPIDLEPLPPAQPEPGHELATPYGVAVSDDDATLVVTAAATSRLFTLDTATGAVQEIVEVGAIPRGVALRSDPATGKPQVAWVLGTLDNTVTPVRFFHRGDTRKIRVGEPIPVGDDPTPDAVRRGRILFNSAFASTSGTFSCASCHPDGHTDQLLWRIGGACFHPGCSGDAEPRLTQPIRGLRNTLPLHWDGSLGDPRGGPNASVFADLEPSCDTEHECFRHLVDASLSGVMCDQAPACAFGPSGLPGLLTEAEREDFAAFLGSVAYPPARSRRIDDSVSGQALDGFRDFFMRQRGSASNASCAESSFFGCHDLPLGVSTNSVALGFFDAPTLRGLTDRFVHFSNGITASEENLAAHAFSTGGQPVWDPDVGYDEFATFASDFGRIFLDFYGNGPDDIFQMVEEASTGLSGATGRQVTLSTASTGGPQAAATAALLDQLEAADARGAVNLRGFGQRAGLPVGVSYDAALDRYRVGADWLTRAELEGEAQLGGLLVTLTGALPQHFGEETHRQPLIAPFGIANVFELGPTGDPALPNFPDPAADPVPPMELEGIDVRADTQILLDGRIVGGSVECIGGAFAPYCETQEVRITLDEIPPRGTYLLQVLSPGGPVSNEVPICVGLVDARLFFPVRCLPDS